MSLGFALVGFVIGVLPVPERVTWRHVLLVTPPVLISAVIAYLLPAVGVLLLLFTLAGYLIVLAPRSWKVTVKLGFRGVGRQPGRTATTLVALFVGVFCVGLILILARHIRSKLNSAISNSATYNVLAIDSAKRRQPGGDRARHAWATCVRETPSFWLSPALTSSARSRLSVSFRGLS